MAANRPKSPKERRDEKNARLFVGRSDQQNEFQRALVQPNHADAKVVFSISGVGGVGKTTLLKEFRRITEKHAHIPAYVDEGVATNPVDDVPEAMHRLVEDLERQGYKSEAFRKRYKDYRVKKKELEADPEGPKNLVKDVVRGTTKAALDLGKSSVPVVGEMIDSEPIASTMGELADAGWQRFRNKDDERLMNETLEELTPLFLEGLNRLPEEKTLVLMLDTYEVTGDFLDAWLRSFLEEEFGQPKIGILVCVAGRKPLDSNLWIEWEGLMARSPLEPFEKEEARQFLAAKGVKSEAIIAEIWRLSSGGLPLLVSMLADVAPKGVDAKVVLDDVCVKAVERFLKWETDDEKRKLAADAACARVLNQDVVNVLAEGQFDWLKGRAFVLRDGTRWRYHLVVREQMLRYLGQKSPKRYAEVHEKLAAYYDGLRSGLGLEVGKEAEDKAWREYSLEWIYHGLCAAPQAKLGVVLNGFLVSLKWSRAFAQDWAEVMRQVGQETKCETLRRWGDQLWDGMAALKKKCYEDALPCLTAILGVEQVEEKVKAVAFYERGVTYALLVKYDEAIFDLENATEIENSIPVYHLILGNTYYAQQRYDEAIVAYERAIELNPEDATAYYNLGITYKAQQRYDEAIVAYERAIELNPEDATAYNNLGITYKAQQRYDEAIVAYERAIELNPEYATAYNNLGNTYKAQQRYDEAIVAYERAIELNPEYATAYNNLGNTYNAQQRYDEAIVAYERAIELNPEDAWAIGKRGEIYLRTNQLEKAIQDFDLAIKLDSDHDWELYLRALAYLKLTQSEAAHTDLQQAIILATEKLTNDSQDGHSIVNLPLYYLAMGDSMTADLHYQKALSAPIERLQEAIQDLDDLLNLFPDHPQAPQIKQLLQAEIKQRSPAT
ncbi:tetratricopeptide repeat protein [filamentous cyanobacterium LEGE 11480]|uniref:Tetratricopeptide repeat protein n=1 Tax=Romeriopsis navalis LEGE 11480 TaxID=2777977 RepID=A0A928VN24_9CYAN|nr:ATP-binding protein [Romeriopsis navalis]MBE9029422.1 tetratricopeptide repeat protein [Romeriopsis navalis LEGE 11480]